MPNQLIPEFSSDGINWSQSMLACSDNLTFDPDDVMRVSFEHLEPWGDQVPIIEGFEEKDVSFMPFRVEWAPDPAKIGPA